MSFVIDLADLSATGDVNDTLLFQRAAAAISANGSGTIALEPGKTYNVFTSSSAEILMDLDGTDGVVVIGNGALIASVEDNPAGGKVVISAQGANNLYVDGLNFTGGNTTLTPSTGEKFIRFGGAGRNLLVTNCIVKDCEVGLQNSHTDAQHYGVTMLNCYFERTFYPLVLYSTDDVFADYITRNCGRSYFAQTPFNHHKIWLDSSSGFSSSDCMLSSSSRPIAGSVTDWTNTASDIEIHYRSPGRQVGSGTCAGALVHLAPQQSSSTDAASHYRDIRVYFSVNGLNIDGDADDFQPRLFDITKLNVSGAADGSRAHTFSGILISGAAHNWDDALGGVRFFDPTMDWSSGGSACGLAIRDFVINGTPVNAAIYVNGQGAATGKQFIIYDNVRCDGELTEANTGGVNIARRSIQTSNVTAYG